jgi:uncharacterized membrane protein YfcA
LDWLLLLLGFLIAVFAAITGVGGGVLFVPLLTLGYGFLPAQAVGTSLMVMVFGGFGATIGYAIQKRVYFRAGLLLALATAPGAILGAYLTAVLSSTVLGVAFGIFLILLATRMILAKRAQRKDTANALLVTCEADCFKEQKKVTAWFYPRIFHWNCFRFTGHRWGGYACADTAAGYAFAYACSGWYIYVSGGFNVSFRGFAAFYAGQC